MVGTYSHESKEQKAKEKIAMNSTIRFIFLSPTSSFVVANKTLKQTTHDFGEKMPLNSSLMAILCWR